MSCLKRAIVAISMLAMMFISGAHCQEIKPKRVIKVMKKIADWQIEHFRDNYSNPYPHHVRDWTNGALYIGMTKWAAIAKTDHYYEWMKKIGEEQNWELHDRIYMADDHTIGQMYVELYRKYKDTTMLSGTLKRFNYILDNPSPASLKWATKNHVDKWSWCDALFMSPPVWAKLASVTGEKKYTKFLLKEYKLTTDYLFDTEEYLYYRDDNYINIMQHDRKVFWSRGNGWVFGGLALILDEYEPGSEEYEYFVDIFKKMAKKLIAIQTPNGHWAMSLLAPDIYPIPETSGTSFFTFGLAWGINNGILDNETYEPSVNRAWNSLVSYITKDGMLGYVQPTGVAPGNAWADKTEVYGTGAFLSAGSEVYKLYSR